MPGSSASNYFDRDKLRAARLAAGLNQRELGERLGVPPSQIGKWEGGFHQPYPRHLAALANALGVQSQDLTTDGSAAAELRTLAQLRIAAGLTQQEAADGAGLLRTHYSRLERGEIASLSEEIAAAVAGELDVAAAEVRTAHARARALYLRANADQHR